MSDSDSTHDQRTGLQEWLVLYAKGVVMGAADAVPGISGGTLALITGIYERLIGALTALDPRVLLSVPRLHREADRRKFLDRLVEMDVPFLIVLGLGVATSLIAVARVVQAALATVPGPTFAFFFGLIGASAVVLADARWLRTPRTLLAGVVGFVVAFLIAGASSGGGLSHSLVIVFGSGVLAISGMVLPGISGAFILLLLGQYDYMTATLNSFVDALIALARGGGTEQVVTEGTVVGTFLGGAVVGLFTVAYAVSFALERYRTATLAFLVSLMIGALRLPVIEVRTRSDVGDPVTVAVLLGTAALGAVIILVLDQYTDDLEY